MAFCLCSAPIQTNRQEYQIYAGRRLNQVPGSRGGGGSSSGTHRCPAVVTRPNPLAGDACARSSVLLGVAADRIDRRPGNGCSSDRSTLFAGFRCEVRRHSLTLGGVALPPFAWYTSSLCLSVCPSISPSVSFSPAFALIRSFHLDALEFTHSFRNCCYRLPSYVGGRRD